MAAQERKQRVCTPYVTGEMRATESIHQQALCRWWAIYARQKNLPESLLIHTPNEGKRHYVTGRLLKSMGMRKGIPDLFLAIPRHGYGGLWIEMKSPKGKPTAEQKDFVSLLNKGGYKAVFCYGWESARETIETYLSEAESALKTQM